MVLASWLHRLSMRERLFRWPKLVNFSVMDAVAS